MYAYKIFAWQHFVVTYEITRTVIYQLFCCHYYFLITSLCTHCEMTSWKKGQIK